MLNTSHEIMYQVRIVMPFGYKKPSDQRAEERDRAKFIFEQQPDLMRKRGINSAEELMQKYWNSPHEQLQRDPHEI